MSVARGYPSGFEALAAHINCANFSTLVQRFLYDQLYPDSDISGSDVDISECPQLHGSPSVFHSAVATFFAPSDLCGIGGMHRERIRATPAWKKGDIEMPRYDCAFVDADSTLPGMRGLHVVRILLLFSFRYHHAIYPCALVQWFEVVGNEPDADTGMWIVKPEYACKSVVHLDCVLRGAHLLPIFNEKFIPRELHCSETLDAFRAFYVNKYIDHHAFEIAF